MIIQNGSSKAKEQEPHLDMQINESVASVISIESLALTLRQRLSAYQRLSRTNCDFDDNDNAHLKIVHLS